MIIQQSTTYSRKFLMVLASDHVTPATGFGTSGFTINISKGASGSMGAAAGVVNAELGNGWYQYAMTSGDTALLGDLAVNITHATADPSDFCDQIQAQVFTQLQMNANGRVLIADNLQQNTAAPFLPFLMLDALTGVPKTGLTVTCQRNLGSGFAPCNQSTATEIANGFYFIALAPSDLNGPSVVFLFTAAGASNTTFTLFTQP